MGRTRHLFSHINLINILLTAALLFLINSMFLPFLNKSSLYSLPVTKKPEKTEPFTGKKQDQPKTPSPLDYMVITEQNLFHPERKIPVAVKEAQPLPKPDFVLYGTLISDDTNIAYMEDKKSPHSSPGREKRQTPLKQGESMSGFTLKELSEDRAIMVRGEERLTVFLIDPQKPKERVVTAPASSTVAQGNQLGSQAPPSQALAPQAPTQQTTAPAQPSGETASKIPSAEGRETTKQKFLELFRGGLKR
jgi:type II secretory pathway component PulC